MRLLGTATARAQAPSPTTGPNSDPLTTTGQVNVDGRMSTYVIHRLPPTSFPDLPSPIADLLTQRSCLIPQTYEAHQPENVVHGAFEHAGSSDWAVLCSVKGTVSLMIFFASASEHPVILASAPETARLQVHGSSPILGFNWGIDPASPTRIHEAQTGMEHRPSTPDHDALADSIIDNKTVFHLYSKGKWTLVDLPD